jgi:hypothetical protein
MKTPYRLGDGWSIGGVNSFRTTSRPIYRRTIEDYPDSILTKYLLNAKKRHDLDTLVSIIEEYIQNNNVTAGNGWNLHIRLGDVIEKSRYSVDEHFKKLLPHSNTNFYIEPVEFFYEKIKIVKECFSEINSVTIYSSYHGSYHGGRVHHAKSDEYLKRVIDIFNESGIEVNLQINNQDIDLDFVTMCKSIYFTQSRGEFSHLISLLVKYYGNCII